MREKVGSDLFRDFGVPCARSVFCRVYVDFGEGPVYFGLYTMLEVIGVAKCPTNGSSLYGLIKLAINLI